MAHPEPRNPLSRSLTIGGFALLALYVVFDRSGLPSFGNIAQLPWFRDRDRFTEDCQGKPQTETALSKQQLAQFLSVAEGAPKQKIRDLIKTPYCQLTTLQVRAGATAQREAYRLEFDENTWLVVLYESDQYTGYRFAQ